MYLRTSRRAELPPADNIEENSENRRKPYQKRLQRTVRTNPALSTSMDSNTLDNQRRTYIRRSRKVSIDTALFISTDSNNQEINQRKTYQKRSIRNANDLPSTSTQTNAQRNSDNTNEKTHLADDKENKKAPVEIRRLKTALNIDNYLPEEALVKTLRSKKVLNRQTEALSPSQNKRARMRKSKSLDENIVQQVDNDHNSEIQPAMNSKKTRVSKQILLDQSFDASMSQVDFNDNFEIQPEMPVIASQSLIAKKKRLSKSFSLDTSFVNDDSNTVNSDRKNLKRQVSNEFRSESFEKTYKRKKIQQSNNSDNDSNIEPKTSIESVSNSTIIKPKRGKKQASTNSAKAHLELQPETTQTQNLPEKPLQKRVRKLKISNDLSVLEVQPEDPEMLAQTSTEKPQTKQRTGSLNSNVSLENVANEKPQTGIDTASNSTAATTSGTNQMPRKRRASKARSIDALNAEFNNNYAIDEPTEKRLRKLKYPDESEETNNDDTISTIKYMPGGWRHYEPFELVPLPNVKYCHVNKHYLITRKNSNGESETKIVKSILKSKTN